ncbi:MAG: hypothetical protein HC833_01880 [Leptolyngbyaceae cyanobacterium RM1_406_9]|nr:hypothetical protein [Leptolyngbyaceae cyanobacterium RM1_406_9]
MAALDILMEVIEMLYHLHIPEACLWILLWLVLAIALLLTANALTIQTVIAAIY